MKETDLLRWRSASGTHEGARRSHNEDRILEKTDQSLWAVADGMGGHAAGDRASAMVVEALEEVSTGGHLSEVVDQVMRQLGQANDRIRDYAVTEQGGSMMGTTVVVLAGGHRHCACVWAGDSRLYRLRDGDLEQLCRDHSEVQRMVEQGVIREEEAEEHPGANVITRAVGAAPELLIDTRVFDVRAGDRYLLCSDGLYNEVGREDIASGLGQGEVEEAARILLAQALDMGARDNVSVVVVEAQPE